MTTIQSVLDSIRRAPSPSLARPAYSSGGKEGPCVGLAVASMKDHTTDEGWQIFQGLQYAGCYLAGHGIGSNITDVREIAALDPQTVVVQDKREWELSGPKDFRDPRAYFRHIETLASRPDIFKVTILKDAQQRPDYHRLSAEEMGCHAWIIYYHPRIVHHLAPYVRRSHLIRTYHTLDASLVPKSSTRLGRALLSGAISNVYPLRQIVSGSLDRMPLVDYLRHPGYHRLGCATPKYLQTLSHYKVAICCSSIYGYALRKLIEATACGCVVLTDLPSDEVLPEIDGNLIRLPDTYTSYSLNAIIDQALESYDPDRQAHYADLAKTYYDYHASGIRLSADIESLRRSYL